MRRVRYQVACSLDGYIAGTRDDFDWIIPEPVFDFEAHFAQFDTLLMGRRTYEIARSIEGSFIGKKVIVASKSLRQQDHPDVEIIGEGLEARIRELRSQPGRDIWLYGGGKLFAQLLEWDLVDTVEPAIIPILLGEGIPFLSSQGIRRKLTLKKQSVYPTGMVLLEYEVKKGREG